jgi:SIR2-like domain
MARILTLNPSDPDFSKLLGRSFQSGHINFLIGSGASAPAIAIAGAVESEIAGLFQANDVKAAHRRLYDFLQSIHEPTNKLIKGSPDPSVAATSGNYKTYLGIVESILAARRTSLLPKQATIFCTNYDLFIEHASAAFPALTLNDGFSRVPSLDGRMKYSSRNFFNAIYNTGNLYSYRVQIPCVNLIKLHGSFSWRRDGDDIIFNVAPRAPLDASCGEAEVDEFLSEHAIVLPQASKFRTTVLESTYYELLRIYANELDRENTLLVAFGFSFGDEHIRGITLRALKNPTLRLIVFAYDVSARDGFATMFDGYNNVEIVEPPAGGTIHFKEFNEALGSFLPKVI